MWDAVTWTPATEDPPEAGWYLVTLQLTEQRIVRVRLWDGLCWCGSVRPLAWAKAPEPFRGNL